MNNNKNNKNNNSNKHSSLIFDINTKGTQSLYTYTYYLYILSLYIYIYIFDFPNFCIVILISEYFHYHLVLKFH